MDQQDSLKPSVVLIGMPGSGKSTLGRDLARACDLPLIDTDRLIEQQTGEKLQQLLDEHGYLKLQAIEAEVILAATFAAPSVISTGGSVIYSAEAMGHLKQSATCAYLEVSLETVRRRVKNLETRGFVRAPGQSLADVYEERLPLYERFADLVLPCDDLSREEILAQLKLLVSGCP